jgi:CHASE1-domain containing sensor protein
VNVVHNRISAWIILTTSLSFTVAAYYFSYQSAARVVEERFDFRAGEVVQAITTRMDVYKSVLRGVVGLFEASEYVSRSEFRQYVDSLDLKKRWP